MTDLSRDASDYFNDGHDSFSLKEYDKALVTYTRALCEGPDERVYHNFALCKYLTGDYHKAIKNYRRATVIKPDFTMAYNGWGFCLANFGRFEEAILKFKKAVETDPGYMQGYLNWGLILYELKEEAEAERIIEKGLKISSLSKAEILERYQLELTSAEGRLGRVANEQEKELLKGQISRYEWMLKFIDQRMKDPESESDSFDWFDDPARVDDDDEIIF